MFFKNQYHNIEKTRNWIEIFYWDCWDPNSLWDNFLSKSCFNFKHEFQTQLLLSSQILFWNSTNFVYATEEIQLANRCSCSISEIVEIVKAMIINFLIFVLWFHRKLLIMEPQVAKQVCRPFPGVLPGEVRHWSLLWVLMDVETPFHFSIRAQSSVMDFFNSWSSLLIHFMMVSYKLTYLLAC